MLLTLPTGCASRASVRQLSGDLAAVKAQVDQLKTHQETTSRELARAAGELSALRKNLDGRAQDEKGVVEQVVRVEGRLQDTEEILRELRRAVDALSRQLTRLPPAPARSAEPLSRRESPELFYSTALRSFRARELGQAVLEFLDFLAKFPGHPLAAQAQFWIGEAYYAQRDYRQALVEFEKVAEHSKGAGRTADALLRIGLCYQALHDPDRARDVWQQIIQEHSGSEAAQTARALLRARPISTHRPQ
jgi:tol-pal system protein YbgF